MTDSSYKISQSKLNLFIGDVLDSIKIGIVVLNAENFIEKMNVGIKNMFGYKQDELQNRPINILFNPNEYNALKTILTNTHNPHNKSSPDKNVLCGIRQDNTSIPLEISITKSVHNLNHIYTLYFFKKKVLTKKRTFFGKKY